MRYGNFSFGIPLQVGPWIMDMDAVSARSTALTPARCPDPLERNGCAGEWRSVARLLGDLGGARV